MHGVLQNIRRLFSVLIFNRLKNVSRGATWWPLRGTTTNKQSLSTIHSAVPCTLSHLVATRNDPFIMFTHFVTIYVYNY